MIRESRYRINKYGRYLYLGDSDRHVSVRIPTSIYDIVMEYEGSIFSEKLVNLIFDYKYFYGLKKSQE